VPAVTSWRLRFEGFEPADEGRREALCTLGNGYFATRAAAPESHADGVHYPGTYIAGCYNRLRSEVSGELVENESLVNVPNWLALTFAIDDGEWLDLGKVDVLDHHLELDLRRGVFTRQTQVRDANGRTTRITQRRFVHMELPHVAALESTFVAEDWSGRLRIRSTLDGRVENTGVPRYRRLPGRHLVPEIAQDLGDGLVLLVTETSQSRIRIAEAARTRIRAGSGEFQPSRTLREGDDWIAQETVVDLAAGDMVTVEKTVTLFTSHDTAISEPAGAATELLSQLPGFDALLERHVLAWEHLWSRFRVSLGDNESALRVLRLHVFHLLQTVSPHSTDLDVGVPARGLHGEAYRGHIFWDELFVLPTLNVRLPELARSLLAYRHRRLPAARLAARIEGHTGAMFPWQSGSDGREESQRLHLNPRSGRWLPDHTHLQRHVGIAIAYNVWKHYEATGNLDFLVHGGAELLLEIARFGSSLTTYDRGRDRYVIKGVVGPDEFHTAYPGADRPGLDNNAYTNVMAVWVLLRALDAIDLLPPLRRTQLLEKLNLGPRERERWEHITHKMFVPFHGDGVISQFEGYELLMELDWDLYRKKYGEIQRLDRILEEEGDTCNRYKASKQADALMLFYLLSAEELGELLGRLGYRLDPASIAATIEYYLARTSHGSTLSAVVHAWVLARLHRSRAFDFFIRALESDTKDVQGGTTAEGIHLAAMAGSVDLLQRCFAGIELRSDTLWINPYWPLELGSLEFDIVYRGQLVTIWIDDERVRIRAHADHDAAVRCGCRDEIALVGPGETIEFTLRS
jgi:trehalose/maltose hydrolase-like predicted phosphorylase